MLLNVTTAALQRSMTNPTHSGADAAAYPLRTYKRPPQSRRSRPENRAAVRKLAPGFLRKKAAPRARSVALQVTETHQESVTYFWGSALGCVVGPNNGAPSGGGAAHPVPAITTRGVLDALANGKNVELIDAGKYTVATDGHNVHVNVRMHYLGEASSDQMAQCNATIEGWWSGTFGRYSVLTTVQTVADGDGDYFSPTLHDSRGTGVWGISNMNGGGMWDVSDEPTWVPAHEMGHGFGVNGDRYDNDGPLTGYKGNIMGERGGIPSEADIINLINGARRQQERNNR